MAGMPAVAARGGTVSGVVVRRRVSVVGGVVVGVSVLLLVLFLLLVQPRDVYFRKAPPKAPTCAACVAGGTPHGIVRASKAATKRSAAAAHVANRRHKRSCGIV